MTVKQICAWCQRHLSGPEDARAVSHGICGVCRTTELVLWLPPSPTDMWNLWQDEGGEG